jgi:hypothetical protein
MATPGAPAFVTLPASTGTIRALARQPTLGAGGGSSSALMAVGSDKAGLIIAKPSTNNTICRIPTQAPVWSVAWSTSNDQQLLLGLDKGRVAQVDLRMSGSRALLFMTGTPGSSGSGMSQAAAAPAAAPPPLQPWHSLLTLPPDWQQQHAAAAAAAAAEGACMPEVLMACPGERGNKPCGRVAVCFVEDRAQGHAAVLLRMLVTGRPSLSHRLSCVNPLTRCALLRPCVPVLLQRASTAGALRSHTTSSPCYPAAGMGASVRASRWQATAPLSRPPSGNPWATAAYSQHTGSAAWQWTTRAQGQQQRGLRQGAVVVSGALLLRAGSSCCPARCS